jgi:hypothetical protein
MVQAAGRVALLFLLTAAVAVAQALSPCSLDLKKDGVLMSFSLDPSIRDPWSHAVDFADQHGITSVVGCASVFCVAGVLVKTLAKQGCDHDSLRTPSLSPSHDLVGLEVRSVAVVAASNSTRANFTALASAAETALRTVRRDVEASTCFSVRHGGATCTTDQTSPAAIAGRAYEEQLQTLATAAAEENRWSTMEMFVTELLSLRRHHLEATAALNRQLAELTSDIAERFSQAPLLIPTPPPDAAVPGCINPEPLDEIGRRTGTDKSSRHHHFLQFYDDQFSTLDSITSVLEIGVKEGRGLATYAEKYPCARIVGLDLEPERSLPGRYEVRFTNQSSTAALESALLAGEEFDVIIDDGGHTMRQQQQTLGAYWGRLRAGGLFIIEDLHTSFLAYYMDLSVSTLDVLLEKAHSPVLDYARVVKSEMEGGPLIMDWQADSGAGHHTTAVLRKRRDYGS